LPATWRSRYAQTNAVESATGGAIRNDAAQKGLAWAPRTHPKSHEQCRVQPRLRPDETTRRVACASRMMRRPLALLPLDFAPRWPAHATTADRKTDSGRRNHDLYPGHYKSTRPSPACRRAIRPQQADPLTAAGTGQRATAPGRWLPQRRSPTPDLCASSVEWCGRSMDGFDSRQGRSGGYAAPRQVRRPSAAAMLARRVTGGS